jgi:hypothetical protein
MKRDPAEELTNVKGYLDLQDKLSNPAFPRIITAVGFDENLVRVTKESQVTRRLFRDADMESVVDDIIEKNKAMREMEDPDSLRVYINTVHAHPDKAHLGAVPIETTVGDLRRLHYRNVEFDDLGKKWNTRWHLGDDVRFVNPKWLDDISEEPLVRNLDPAIRVDVEGEPYFVRHLPSGNESQYPVDLATAKWAKDFYRMMKDFRQEFVDSRWFDKYTEAANPITQFYVPRDYAKRQKIDLQETLLSDDIYSSSRVSFEKSREKQFGLPYGDVEKFRELYVLPEKRLSKLISSYARKSSSKLTLHDLAEATARLYGIPKSRFMKAYKETSNGRGVSTIIADPLVGSRIQYGKEITRKGEIAKERIQDLKFKIERRADEEWNKILKEARDKKGNERKGGLYKIYNSTDGEEYVLPAAVANEVKIFKDGHVFFNNITQNFLANSALKGPYWAWKKMDRAAKRGILVTSPSYMSINVLTDTFMVNQSIGLTSIADFKRAMKFLEDPSSVTITIDGLGTKIPGSVIMREGRSDGHFLQNIDRLEDFSGVLDPSKRLELAALRANGKGIKWDSWEKAIKPRLKLARAKVGDVGLKQGENFVAQWNDLIHAVGYLKSLQKGRSFRQASDDVFDALIDYSDRTRMLNAVRMFAPFATWAVKSPKSVAKGFARKPRYVTIPVRIQDEVERITIREEGPTYYLPKWMRETGNYRRTPKAFRPVLEIGRKLLGGEEISDKDQVFLKTRMMPVFESLQPYMTVLSGGSGNPFVMQLSPAFKAIYENVWADRDIRTMRPFPVESELKRPFARGTPFVPAPYEQEGFPFVETALSPDQPAWFSRDLIPYLGALPEAFPGQRLMLSRSGIQAMNTAQFLASGKTSDPFIFGAVREYTDPERGSEALGQTWQGLMTGYTPAVVSPGMSLSALLQDQGVDGKDRRRILKEQRATKKQLDRALRRLEMGALKRSKE